MIATESTVAPNAENFVTRLAVVGMSHVEALSSGWDTIRAVHPDIEFIHYNLRRFRRAISDGEVRKFGHPVNEEEQSRIEQARQAPVEGRGGAFDQYIDVGELVAMYAQAIAGADAVAFNIEGNEHNIIGLVEIRTTAEAISVVRNGVRKGLEQWLDLLMPASPGKVALIMPPPPIGSIEHIRRRADVAFQKKLEEYSVRADADRLEIWRQQCKETAAVARERGFSVVSPPASVFAPDGLMAEECYGADATHGNALYGARVMDAVVRVLTGERAAGLHPYADLPEHAYWRQSVSEVAPAHIDPLVTPKFRISPGDKVATAGSCFAQHISKRLRANGFSFYTAEPSDCAPGGGVQGVYDFSARYGNVYTARQLLQLFERAFGYFVPLERAWERHDGRFCDPFRPRIEPAGYASEQDVCEESSKHLAAVRRMFCDLDIFVFTLGLTECWLSKLDGAAFPVAPGVAGGSFNPDRHQFVNFDVAEVTADLDAFFSKLAMVNPHARTVLTVSPVPLVATYSGNHVLASTTYSKSVLRVAAEQASVGHTNVQYFPSYEIITGPHAQGGYFAADRRSVTEEGVNHVMRVFMSRMTTMGEASAPVAGRARQDLALNEMQAIIDASCDEELYTRGESAQRQA